MSDELPSGDVMELGGRRFLPPGWRPSRGAAVLAAATLVAGLAAGLAAGYAAGDRHARAGAPRPGPAAARTPPAAGPVPAATFSFADSPPLTQGTGACSAQSGRELQLGVQVTSDAPVPLTLTTVRAAAFAGALRQVAWRWGPCGALPGQAGTTGQPGQPDAAYEILLPGASVWLTATFLVRVRCPAPYPVRLTVGYLAGGRAATVSLAGFPDLGHVPYSGCPSGTSAWMVHGS